VCVPSILNPPPAGSAADYDPFPAQIFLLHKLRGELVTRTDPDGRRTIFDRLRPMGVMTQAPPRRGPRAGRGAVPADSGRPAAATTTVAEAAAAQAAPLPTAHLMPVGRLDMNSEGLLLLTNDGGLAAYLTHPSTQMERVYHVRVYGRLAANAVTALQRGANIGGGEGGARAQSYRPVRVRVLAEAEEGARGANPRANTWLELTLTEGKVRGGAGRLQGGRAATDPRT
jgi:23S rRNA pseudouridine2605 synthase